MNNSTIEAPLLKANTLYLFILQLFILAFVGILATAIASRLLHLSIFFVILSVILFLVLPLIFATKRINSMAKKTLIHLSDSTLEFDVFENNFQLSTKKYRYALPNISSYQVTESVKDNLSYLRLFIKSGEKIKFIFLKQQNNESNVLKNVRVLFAEYNKVKDETNKIKLRPSFLASNAGKHSLNAIAFLIGLVIVLQIIYKPQTLPFSLLIGILLYSRMRSQRKMDLDLYKKFRED